MNANATSLAIMPRTRKATAMNKKSFLLFELEF